jgi:hypothetical protein
MCIVDRWRISSTLSSFEHIRFLAVVALDLVVK